MTTFLGRAPKDRERLQTDAFETGVRNLFHILLFLVPASVFCSLHTASLFGFDSGFSIGPSDAWWVWLFLALEWIGVLIILAMLYWSKTIIGSVKREVFTYVSEKLERQKPKPDTRVQMTAELSA